MDETQIVTFARAADFGLDARLHCLEVLDGQEQGRTIILNERGLVLGRSPPAEIVLNDSEISRAHCRFVVVDGDLMMTDLNSTNGTVLDGARVKGTVTVPVGAILRLGRHTLKHELWSEKEILQHDEFDREIRKASAYVHALLPQPITVGPIRAEWSFQPCSKLGGDAFGYGPLNDNEFLVYMIDVSGHGAGAAMHSVAVMNLLRQRAVPGASMSEPAQVLAALNAMFQMDDHAGMYFTMWYGVFNRTTRELRFATAGHHPAFLLTGGDPIPLRTRGMVVGGDPGTVYRVAAVQVPPEADFYLFSDGVFEIVTKEGQEWRLDDFLRLLPGNKSEEQSETAWLFAKVRGLAKAGGLDDDFSLLLMRFQ
jgi:serine phosphatase RsbU (regulator of sigma subunit)